MREVAISSESKVRGQRALEVGGHVRFLPDAALLREAERMLY